MFVELTHSHLHKLFVSKLLPTGRVFGNDRHGGTHVASPRRAGTSHSTAPCQGDRGGRNFTQPGLQCLHISCILTVITGAGRVWSASPFRADNIVWKQFGTDFHLRHDSWHGDILTNIFMCHRTMWHCTTPTPSACTVESVVSEGRLGSCL